MRYVSLILVFGLVFGFCPLAFGEESSKELTQKAALSLAQGKSAQAIESAQKCIDTFGKEAKTQQKKIKALGKKTLNGQPKEVFEKYRVLNDVGMCQFIIGEAYRTEGKSKEANQAYKKVITEYPESRSLLEVQKGTFVLNKLADEAENRTKLDPRNEFYKLPIVLRVY